jgi:hypothetical protein
LLPQLGACGLPKSFFGDFFDHRPGWAGWLALGSAFLQGMVGLISLKELNEFSDTWAS